MISQGRLFALLFLTLTLTACGPKGPKRWESFPITLYGDQTINSDPLARADLEDAIVFWENKAGQKLFEYRGAWTGSAPFSGRADDPEDIVANVIFFLDPWAFGNNIAGHTIVMSQDEEIQNSIIMLNPHTQLCSRDCIGNSGHYTSQRKVFAHELGHFIGLSHVEDQKNIMYPGALPGSTLQDLQVDGTNLLELTE